MNFMSYWLEAFLAGTAFLIFTTAARANETPVDYNRDVRPILSAQCLNCHGQDEHSREADLRLDRREDATAELISGLRAIVPGDEQNSELLARITTDDEFLRMPPADAGEALSEDEIQILRQWIREGAPYAQHWAFVAPQRWPLPRIENPAWPQQPLDYFVAARLQEEGLRPSAEASRYALARRVSLDLRGLPPTPREIEAFIADESPRAYERFVDRLLSDSAFGEHWARVWLDLARYADSRGYGSDPLRTNMWRYRDWVIDAYNRNLPFDQFTLEQLAGDLLPSATLEQRMATAFHRNTMTNTEGGTDDEEFRVAAVKDRAETTVRVWMGLTMQCANCHEHKYDPISQEDYYRFYAIFNQTADADLPNETPNMEAPTPWMLEQRTRIADRIAHVNAQIKQLQQTQKQAPKADSTKLSARFVRIEIPGKGKMVSLAEVQIFSGDQNVALQGTAGQSSTDFEGPPELAIDGNTDGHYFNAKSTTHTAVEDDPWWEVDLGADFSVDRIVLWNRTDGEVESRLSNFRLRLLDASRNPVWEAVIAEYPDPHSEFVPRPQTAAEKEIDRLREEVTRLKKTLPEIPTLPVMQELPRDKFRTSFVMLRGNFLSPGETVEPGFLSSFPARTADLPADRLGAAKWLVDEANPLTARVAVNRVWARLFGIGLVETEEDFGTQGEPPSHPRLLDWLATEFVRLGWDHKRLLRTIVTSATYRQNSAAMADLIEKDPQNRLLARGPRFRLEAEMVRDQALALSGLLSCKMHGPSVYPYQPPGLWRAAFNGQRTWPTSQGEDKFRRGLYTFWRRTVPYPSMQAFDAPSRELCTLRRIRTNTPIQAFVTLNDPVYVEAAQALARRILREGGDRTERRIQFALELCLCRPANREQCETLTRLWESEREHFQQHPDDAKNLATDPLGPPSPDVDIAELAAWTVVANVLLNLDAVLTKG
jgi:hypothetical protein